MCNCPLSLLAHQPAALDDSIIAQQSRYVFNVVDISTFSQHKQCIEPHFSGIISQEPFYVFGNMRTRNIKFT